MLIPTLEIAHPSFVSPIRTCTGFEDRTLTLDGGEIRVIYREYLASDLATELGSLAHTADQVASDRTAAVATKGAAETARDHAQRASAYFPSVSEALELPEGGAYFQVAEDGYVHLYLNNSGSAKPILKMASQESLEKLNARPVADTLLTSLVLTEDNSMTLRTHALNLTGSDQTAITVPEGQEATCNNILCTGTGDLTLKFKEASTGTTYTVFDGKTVTDEIALDRSFNLTSGDQLIASGTGLSLFVSAYYVGASQGGAVLAYGPGPQVLQEGDMSSGYFGEVSAAEFYSGNRLALELGVTEGTLQNSDEGWLKFASKGKVLFVAKQSLMHSVSWDHLYSRGIVYGTDDNGKSPRGTPKNQRTLVEHGSNQFIVRLMTCASATPFPDSGGLYGTDDMVDMDIGGGSEWNTLMYRVCEDVPTSDGTDGARKDRHGGPQAGDNWAEFTGAELNVSSGDGRFTWGQEQAESSSSSRVYRGSGDVAYFNANYASNAISPRGWRPALELIPSP